MTAALLSSRLCRGSVGDHKKHTFYNISARIARVSAFTTHKKKNRDTSSCENGQHAKGGATSDAVHIRGIAGGATQREAISTLVVWMKRKVGGIILEWWVYNTVYIFMVESNILIMIWKSPQLAALIQPSGLSTRGESHAKGMGCAQTLPSLH